MAYRLTSIKTGETSMRNTSLPRESKPLVSVEEAAVLLGETRSTLYRAIKDGNFPIRCPWPVSQSPLVATKSPHPSERMFSSCPA